MTRETAERIARGVLCRGCTAGHPLTRDGRHHSGYDGKRFYLCRANGVNRLRIMDALVSARADGERAGLEKAAKAALQCRYGPPSMWKAENPAGWLLDDTCSPRDASMHDNGCVDAFKAIRALKDGTA